MKITHVIPALTRGGAERVVVDLANSAVGRGHEVTILVAHLVEGGADLYQLDPRVKVKAVRRHGSVRSTYGWLAPWVIAHRRWLLGQDIIHCHLTFGAVLGSLLRPLRRLSGETAPKIVETSHAVGMPIPTGRRKLLARLASHRDGYVLMAEDSFWKGFAADHPELPIRIIPNGTRLDYPAPDPERQSAYRAKAGLPAEADLVVGTIGRISPDRNPAVTLQIFSQIAAEVPDCHILMGGDGPLLESLKARVEADGLSDRIHFPGLVVDVPLTLSLIDLYVSINIGPITGLAGLEAAAFGVPVISLQARNDYEGGSDDWIWSSPRPAEVALEGARLLRSPEERKSIVARQREHVRRHYSHETAALAYEDFYRELLS